jgi:hypothetical protein
VKPQAKNSFLVVRKNVLSLKKKISESESINKENEEKCKTLEALSSCH